MPNFIKNSMLVCETVTIIFGFVICQRLYHLRMVIKKLLIFLSCMNHIFENFPSRQESSLMYQNVTCVCVCVCVHACARAAHGSRAV
jgi:hypothetical protein